MRPRDAHGSHAVPRAVNRQPSLIDAAPAPADTGAMSTHRKPPPARRPPPPGARAPSPGRPPARPDSAHRAPPPVSGGASAPARQPRHPRASKPPAPPVAARPPALPRELRDATDWASRGSLKLLGAIEAFALLETIRGADCVDVGASTGGFTDVLLRCGARHVTALDVGHDQLVERLRSDARVTVLEKTHIRTAALSVAPGPFDFFVVDVSFLAGRTVLKPLARRLRDGAEGVVLVKPQFELPTQLVPKGGVIESRNLRKLAWNRFRRKAVERGYAILGRIESPIAGGSGNVEFLAHLRFLGHAAAAPDADGRDN
jgi:23S rRNA (cytidine1920-2'-O)/16S rRNA (cytidine1409-2'-O)-methyltransferase